MILETCQLLATAHHVLNPEQAQEWCEQGLLYRKTHFNHPCAKWARAHVNNYNWLCLLGLSLCQEYSRRYSTTGEEKKVHACVEKFQFLIKNVPASISRGPVARTRYNPCGLTVPIPQVMPKEFYVPPFLPTFTCQSCHDSVQVFERVESQDEYQNVTYTCVECKCINTVCVDTTISDAMQAYKNVYHWEEKSKFRHWKHGQVPEWFDLDLHFETCDTFSFSSGQGKEKQEHSRPKRQRIEKKILDL